MFSRLLSTENRCANAFLHGSVARGIAVDDGVQDAVPLRIAAAVHDLQLAAAKKGTYALGTQHNGTGRITIGKVLCGTDS